MLGVSMCMHLVACVYICAYAYMKFHVRANKVYLILPYIFICLFVYVYVCIQLHACIPMSARFCVSLCICINISIYVYVSVCEKCMSIYIFSCLVN